MTQFLRRMVFISLFAWLPLLAGCASDSCKFLVYEDELPEASPPLVIPGGIPAPVDSGRFQVPSRAGTAPAGCAARPPMTLPENVLESSEDNAD